MITDHDIEVVRSRKYLRTVISHTEDETEEIKARILGAKKAYYSLETIFTPKQMQQNNKI
jgi:hypothetical protein